MSLNLIGALVGLVVAVVDFVVLRALARRVELPETRRALNVAGLAQFVVFPAMGWFVGPLIAGE